MTAKRVEELTSGELEVWVMSHLLMKQPDRVNSEESTEALEICARLRERDAARGVDFLGDPHQRYNDHKNGWNDAISSVRSAMLAARKS